MTKMKKVVFVTLCILLVTITGVSALGPPVVEPYGGLPYRMINVDGDPSDWGGIQPIATDPPTDANNPREEVIAIYAANDEENLYFLMELLYVEAASADVVESYGGEYCFFIDIIPGEGNPDSGADYKIVHSITGTPNPGESQLTELFSWSGSCWIIECGCTGVRGNSSMYIIEVGVPWSCIEGPDCFNSYFYAHFEPPENLSDYVPDPGEGYVLLGCCPGYPPVGGEIMPISIQNYIIPLIVALAVIILIKYIENNSLNSFF